MLNEEKFLELARAKYAEINKLNEAPTLLDYELGLQQVMREMMQTVMNEQLGGQTGDRRKKKVHQHRR